ncbi:hypothetical protein BSG18_55680 [Pseudomonas ogarae]|nr:hypothetical protein BSF43_57970 [Pseudomonas ogarae]PBJ16872.1 hypothetical protein BSG18_55680 [Pseudomonas ogarae]
MARETVEEFVAWLERKPQTHGFDAILAYDQNKTNLLLMQEYIQKFSSDHYFDPISFDAEFSSGTNWEYIYDYILDAPRLSFETSDITASDATLTMRIVGGTQLSVNKGVGEKVRWVSRVRLADAVNGPLLRMTIQLRDKPGTVDTLGRVTLDLSKGTKLYVTVGDSMEQDQIAGEKFQKKFDAWEDDQKVFELNTLTRDPSDLLQPEKFYIRTHPAPGGDVLNAPNFGEGEVLVFIQMKGGAPDDAVAIPPSNAGMHYLIPEGEGSEPLSATILLGNHFLLKNIVADGFKRISEAPVEVVSDGVEGEHIQSLTPAGGARRATVADQAGIPDIKNFALPSGLTLPFSQKDGAEVVCEFFARINRDILVLRWEGKQPTPVNVVTVANQTIPGTVTVKWRWQQSFKFSTAADGQLSLKPETAAENLKICKVSPDDFIGKPQVEPHLGPILDRLESVLREQLDNSYSLFTSTVPEIDAFRLNGLLFRTQNAVLPTSGYFTGDLALLGKVAPSLTNFVIDPLEPVIGPGGSILFGTQPAAIGLVWSVTNLPGETGDPGTINGSTGAYDAPNDTNITGYQKRVLVTARAGNGNSSRALVSIVKRDIGVDPLVFVATARSEGEQVSGHKMSAAALDGAKLVWSLASGSTADIQEEPEPTPGLENQKRFIPPLFQGTAGTPITIEEIMVTRESGGPVQKAIAVVVHHASTYYIRTAASADKRRLTVTLCYTDKNGVEKEAPIDEVEFTKLYGDGTFSDTGEYELPAVPSSKFAVLMAVREDDESWKYDFLIVPNPIVDVQSFIEPAEL